MNVFMMQKKLSMTVSLNDFSNYKFVCIFQMGKFVSGMRNHPLSEGTYEQINRRTEFVTKIIVFTTIYVLYPIGMILILIANFYMYFFMGVDAFRLPIPYWYASVCDRINKR